MNREVPDFLGHLEVFNGYPVPFVQMWIDGKPDFRVIDPEKSLKVSVRTWPLTNKATCSKEQKEPTPPSNQIRPRFIVRGYPSVIGSARVWSAFGPDQDWR